MTQTFIERAKNKSNKMKFNQHCCIWAIVRVFGILPEYLDDRT